MKRLIWLTTVLSAACVNSRGRDAGNPDTVPPIDVSDWVGIVDSGTVRYWEEIGKAKRCEAADLDGDGIRELLCLRSEDGTTTLIKESNGPLEWKVEHFADGRIRYTYWYKTSLQPDLVDEKFPDGRRMMLFDNDHDRKFERRLDEEPDGGDIVATEYADAGATWVSIAGWVRPASSDQGVNTCNGNSNFPSERGWWQGGGPAVFSDNANVRCTPAERSKIGAAFECAKKKLECVKRTNETLGKQVEAHLADDDFLYGCNNPCINANASTLASSLGYKAQTNFNRNLLRLLTPEQACSTVLHEMMHASGVEADKATHDDGKDQIYSCARYCSGCIDYGGKFGGAGEPAFPSDNLDCVRCAQDPADKKRCGIKPTLKGGQCPTNNFCHAGLAGNAPCQTCKAEKFEDCEGTPVTGELFNCCEMCPAPIDTSNDVPCPKPLVTIDGCSMKPPECPR